MIKVHLPSMSAPDGRGERLGVGRLSFCSHRCRMVDFGRWLGEEYRVTVAPDEEDTSDLDEANIPP